MKLLLEKGADNGEEVYAKEDNLEMNDCANSSTASSDNLNKITVE